MELTASVSVEIVCILAVTTVGPKKESETGAKATEAATIPVAVPTAGPKKDTEGGAKATEASTFPVAIPTAGPKKAKQGVAKVPEDSNISAVPQATTMNGVDREKNTNESSEGNGGKREVTVL
ncbi:unnamed protein product [Dicrocoelium dendriticum]|nr:unnamed protein product [Dicrocoelium dendriticum]